MTQTCLRCGYANADESEVCARCKGHLQGGLEPGTLLQDGRYEILRPLGGDETTFSYLALDRVLGSQWSICENLDTTPQGRQRFESEMMLLARLHHPNLPEVCDLFVGPEGRQYAVIEYVEGEGLDQVQRSGGTLAEKTVLGWADSLLDALEYVHAQAEMVPHRDIRPSRIKRRATTGGTLKLLGLGIVGAGESGNPFAAPEYGGGDGGIRADIYALGATMYALLTGETPPSADERGRGAVLTSPHEQRADLSMRTSKAILKAMALNPRQRYQSVAQMRRAISPRRRSLRPILLAAAALSLVVLAGLTLAWIRNNGELSTATPTLTPVPTPSSTATLIPTPTPAPTSTPVPTLTPVPTFTPVTLSTPVTPTAMPGEIGTPTPTSTRAPTHTPTATFTPTNTPMPAYTWTPTTTPTPASAPQPTSTPKPKPKPTKDERAPTNTPPKR